MGSDPKPNWRQEEAFNGHCLGLDQSRGQERGHTEKFRCMEPMFRSNTPTGRAFAARATMELPKTPVWPVAISPSARGSAVSHPTCCAAAPSPTTPCSGRPAEPGRDTVHICLYFKLRTVSPTPFFVVVVVIIKIFQKGIKTIPPPSPSLPATFPRCQLISDAQLVHSHL